MTEILNWVTETLQAASMGPVALPLAFLLGLVSAVASACCTVPAMGMLVAYSGTRQDVDRRSAFTSAVWFLVGTTLALIILGFVAGFVGQTAQAFLGRYWKLFAGVVAVVLGLATLKLLPFRLPSRARKDGVPSASGRKMGAAMGGLLLGGGVAACSLPCNPGHLHRHRRKHTDGAHRVGHGSHGRLCDWIQPAARAILFGVSFGKASIKAQKADAAIRAVAGVLLVCAGFYLLVTF